MTDSPHARPAVLERLTPGREGLDRTLFLIVTAAVALTFSNPAWHSLHGLGWLLLVGDRIRSGRRIGPFPRRWVIPWAALAGWSLLSAALGPDPAGAVYDSKKSLNILALFLFAAVLRSAQEYLRVLAVLCTVLGAQAVVGLTQYALNPDPVEFRVHGSLSHHMTYAGMLLITAAMALPQVRTRGGRSSLLWGTYVALAVGALLASLTRSAWLGLVIAMVVALAIRAPRWLWALPAFLAVVFLTVPEVRHRVWSITDVQQDFSNQQRLRMYPTGLRMIAHHPLLGLGGRKQVRYRYLEFEPDPPLVAREEMPLEPVEPPLHLHNNALQIGAASGLPALIAWLGALLVYFRDALRQLRTPPRDWGPRRRLLLGSLCAVSAFLTMGMLEYNMGDTEVSVLFFFVLSVPLALGRQEGSDEGAP